MGEGQPALGRQRWALVVAVVVVLVVIGVVVIFGLIPYPDLPTVAEQPDPPVTARLAHTTYDRSGPCLHVVDGRGQEHELGCGETYAGDVVWLEDGRLGVRSYSPDGSVVDVLDPDTGEVVDQQVQPRGDDDRLERRNDEGQLVTTGGHDGLAWLEVTGEDEGSRRVLELEGPSSYALYDARWSADGRWLVAQDSAGRVLVVPADGRGDARIWATDVGSIAVR